jgi:hypothetical protein
MQNITLKTDGKRSMRWRDDNIKMNVKKIWCQYGQDSSAPEYGLVAGFWEYSNEPRFHNLPTPWSRVLLEKPTIAHLLKNFPTFHGTRSSLSCQQEPASGLHPEPEEPSPHTHPISLTSIVTLSSHLRLGLPSGLFALCFPTKALYAFLLYLRRATCPSNLTSLTWSF